MTTRLNINLCNMDKFRKTNGAESRNDRLVRIGEKRYVLIFGYGVEDGNGYDWRKIYDHSPSEAELKNDVESLINSITDEKILNGFVWNGRRIYLSSNNQINFSSAYLIGSTTEGSNLPLIFKVGEYDGSPVYQRFETMDEFSDFYNKSVEHIKKCIEEGWKEKDSVDYVQIMSVL